MSEEQKKFLEKQLWAIANLLRGRMDADDYRNYILGFIFYKYLSEKLHYYANEILKPDNKVFTDINENTDEGKKYARPMKKEWALNIKKQCEEQNVAFFFKQWGIWGSDGVRRSKKSNGRILEGKEWNADPELIN